MEVNRHMLGLTRESVDDSATVRVVGVMTLIYLPATFVAVSFAVSSNCGILVFPTANNPDSARNESSHIRVCGIKD